VTVSFRITSLGKQCTSYNAPPTSRKRARPLITSKFLASEPRNRMGRNLNWILCSAWKKRIDGTPLELPPYSSDLAPCDFWAFPTMKRELRGKRFRSNQRSAARFGEVGGALYEVPRLPREILRKRDRHRTSTKFRLGVIRWVHELRKRPSYFTIYLCTFFVHTEQVTRAVTLLAYIKWPRFESCPPIRYTD
jgi:hypothetical protein